MLQSELRDCNPPTSANHKTESVLPQSRPPPQNVALSIWKRWEERLLPISSATSTTPSHLAHWRHSFPLHYIAHHPHPMIQPYQRCTILQRMLQLEFLSYVSSFLLVFLPLGSKFKAVHHQWQIWASWASWSMFDRITGCVRTPDPSASVSWSDGKIGRTWKRDSASQPLRALFVFTQAQFQINQAPAS